MRQLITAALLAATALVPAAASAQSRGELRRDRQDIREERNDLRDAQRRGDYRGVQDARGDLRDARQEYREDLRDYRRYNRNFGRNDWNRYRDRNRSIYRGGNYNAPFRYNSFRSGTRIGSPYFAQRYWINDPYRYRLPRPAFNQRWVRHYNDVLLIDVRRGIVLDVIRRFYF